MIESSATESSRSTQRWYDRKHNSQCLRQKLSLPSSPSKRLSSFTASPQTQLTGRYSCQSDAPEAALLPLSTDAQTADGHTPTTKLIQLSTGSRQLFRAHCFRERMLASSEVSSRPCTPVRLISSPPLACVRIQLWIAHQTNATRQTPSTASIHLPDIDGRPHNDLHCRG